VLHCGEGSPREARRFVADVLTSWGCEAAKDVAQLMVSELVTNAVLHGHCFESTVTVRDVAGSVKIAVTDPEPAPPSVTDTGPMVPGGQGMHIVATLAHRWGVEPCACGKSVWFEVTP
jgi:anti-sigma regulatory factor (Ser/Thr protein kinase)